MSEMIKLDSRYKENNYLKRINENEKDVKMYVLETESGTYRYGMNNNNRIFLDPPGGPMLVTGNRIKEAKAVIKAIKPDIKYGYVIILEDDIFSNKSIRTVSK